MSREEEKCHKKITPCSWTCLSLEANSKMKKKYALHAIPVFSCSQEPVLSVRHNDSATRFVANVQKPHHTSLERLDFILIQNI
mmetsp:Transcript_9002/g.13925  ORF Transcript_9002/g.13925 Transcript_9002/m.13925 type:complete len:83 (+) Transcript_9002:411-659(+)